jgi:hypothetical protein
VGSGHPQLPIETIPNAKLKAVLDLHPTKFVRKTVASRLQSIPGFQGLITQPLTGGFGFDLTNLHAIGVINHSHPPFFPPLPPLANPSFEASVLLQSTHFDTIRFLANLEGLPAHHACIFHLMHTNLTNVVLSGLTLVIVHA